MAIANNNGVRLHWQEQGRGSPILLVMGHSYSSALWYPILPALTAKHRVVWFDNRGTGESDTTRQVTVPELAADALAVMDAAGLERAHLFGISMGGVIAIELAHQQPRRATSLVLGATGILSAEKPRLPAALRVLYYLPRWLLRLLMSGRAGDKAYGSAATRDQIAFDRAVLAKDKSTVRGVVAQAVAVSAHYVTKETVAALTMPALVIHGDEDGLVPVAWGAELAETLPNGRMVTMPGAGHNFMVARREQASAAVLDFLRGVENGIVPGSCDGG
ncbi:MAG: alpha/beta fold hydrolase [Gemmatimonadales bacterium]